ncbi:hypothetical protein, partial [Actinomyces viscosus]|uniref:hypothetical protein n=1 Tax=Actinomyces viscosus TaxID=1656 RepID=UPI0028EDC41C
NPHRPEHPNRALKTVQLRSEALLRLVMPMAAKGYIGASIDIDILGKDSILEPYAVGAIS